LEQLLAKITEESKWVNPELSFHNCLKQ
jgi:hypothetical protein